jgi:hypothetical protein
VEQFYGLVTALEVAWVISGFVGLWMLREKGVLRLGVPGWIPFAWLMNLVIVSAVSVVGGGFLIWWARGARDRHCRHCRKLNDPQATVCPYCGREPFSSTLPATATG